MARRCGLLTLPQRGRDLQPFLPRRITRSSYRARVSSHPSAVTVTCIYYPPQLMASSVGSRRDAQISGHEVLYLARMYDGCRFSDKVALDPSTHHSAPRWHIENCNIHNLRLSFPFLSQIRHTESRRSLGEAEEAD